jgi:glycosyltransferase involved in cell wall biosynthesis
MRKKTIFFVTGRLGKTLVYTKVLPFIKTGYFSNVLIFSENTGFEINGAKYIEIPKIFKNLKIFRNILIRLYEPIQLLMYSIKYHPDYINGIYTIPKGLNAFIVSKLTKSKSIVSVIGGNVEIDTKNILIKKLNLFMLKHCDIITTKGNNITNFLVSLGIKKEKIFEFPGYVNTNLFNYKQEINKDIDIIFVGTFRKLKGPDRIVMMVNDLKKYFPNIKAELLGEGYLYQTVKELIYNLNLENNVFLRGYRNDTYQFFQRSKIVVMPSRSEGLPMAMLEAMACGCVPVVSNVGNVTDAAIDGVNSFVIDNYLDIESFVEKIKYLLENDEIRIQMAKNASEIIMINFSLLPQTEIAKKIIEYGETL